MEAGLSRLNGDHAEVVARQDRRIVEVPADDHLSVRRRLAPRRKLTALEEFEDVRRIEQHEVIDVNLAPRDLERPLFGGSALLNAYEHPFQLFAVALGQLKLLADNDRSLPPAGQATLQQVRELTTAFHDLRPRQPAMRLTAFAMCAAEHQHGQAIDRASPTIAVASVDLHRGLIGDRGG